MSEELHRRGYIDVTAGMLLDVIDAWIAGKREHDLPRGAIGFFAGQQFDKFEQEQPGVLGRLK